ncbi:MAG TPA: hybrid sensor histidine kinase/response regulator [Nitrospirales bacterium]|nr:hybrid sensor histidine kinase/response regulator [Nitrospirales bacterium]
MASDFDRQALLSIFTAEASDGLLKLAKALDPRDGSTPTQESLRKHFIIAHSLTGASSLYGFTGCASLAKILARILEQTGNVSPTEWPGTVKFLRDIVTTLRAQINNIDQESTEDPTIFEDLKTRYTSLLSEFEPTPLAAEPAPNEAALPDSYFRPDLEAEVLEYFVPEAQEYLEAISSCLLRIEQDPTNKDTIQQLFRAAHTLKGSAYTIGFQAIGDMTHHIEDIMGAIREGKMPATAELTDLFFRAVDEIRLLLGRDPAKLPQIRQEFSPLKQRLHQVATGQDEKAQAPSVATPPTEPTETQPPCEEPRTTLPATVKAEVPAAAKPKELPQPAGAKELTQGTVRVSRDRLERLLNLVGELVIGRSRLEQRLTVLEQLARQVQAYKNRMLETVRTFEEKHAFTLPTVTGAGAGSQSPLALPGDFGALEFDKYDDFNILARRMTEVSADVSEAMAQLSTSIRNTREDMGLLQQMTTDLRDEIAHTRMVPIGSLFTRFQKTIREMARTVGKDVEVVFSGASTEVDAGVVQRLVDPLIHMMRNAVAHGIEPPAVRKAAGKPEKGTVYLHAFNQRNTIAIEIEDDGAGLNVEKIKATAIALGLVRPERAATMPPADLIELIYLPGFSTTEEVGDQAGRGVGMDVIRHAVTDMNGQIDIETEPGVGTKFTLTLPLNMLISTALMVRAGDQQYAMPLPTIREVIVPPSGAVNDISGRPTLQIGEREAIEVLSLALLLGVEPTPHEGPVPVVVIHTPKGVLGIEVDELLGLQEIVIKTLGSLRLFQGSCYSGATIDPEGRVVLVVDVPSLFKQEGEKILPEAVPLHEPLQLAAGSPKTEQENLAVLLVDDSLSVRKFIGRMLEAAGYTVQTACDGEEGLRKATAASFQVIIADLEMPKMNGYELIQALRDRPETKSTPIIVMTTRAGEKHRQIAQSLGVSSYLTKPVEERALIKEISQFVSAPTASKP